MVSSANHAGIQFVPDDGHGYPQFTYVYKMGYQNEDISTQRTIKTQVTLVRVTGEAKLLLNQTLTDFQSSDVSSFQGRGKPSQSGLPHCYLSLLCPQQESPGDHRVLPHGPTAFRRPFLNTALLCVESSEISLGQT